MWRTLCNEPYHILIDLSNGEDPVLEYIVHSSKACFKLGRQHPGKEELYDMMIEMPGKELKLDEYLKHVEHYLSIINKG